MTELYPWIKSLHIISVIAWMAGQLYLPRLFVYHAGVPVGSQQSELFKVMEYKLYRFIMTPAMIATAIFGFALVLVPGVVDLTSGWIHAKLLFVLGLFASHGLMSRWRKDFAADRNQKSARYFRVANELPTLLMIVIVILVVVKPF